MIQTLRDWLTSILGTYEPVTYLVKGCTAYGGMDGGNYHEFTYTKVADGLAGLDWEYVVTALVLVITIYSVFRLMGILLSTLSGGKKW